MSVTSKCPQFLAMFAILAVPASGSLLAQEPASSEGDVMATIYGTPPADLSGLNEGPDIEGIISARTRDRIQVTREDGTNAAVAVSAGTEIRASEGLFGLGSDKLSASSLLNGLPVSIETVEWGGGLVASEIDLKNKDLRTASMIRSGTAQGFAEQTAATEALRGRMGDIDKYNIKGTTNVNFDIGEAVLSARAKADLCAAASQAEATENALMLVVGYTDSTGSQEFNQELSEKRAGRVINYLQQHCGWEPYRMLTPTGMAEADPLADNDTVEGRALNRRVAVNILVSKSVEGL